jgi:hypothetical protein
VRRVSIAQLIPTDREFLQKVMPTQESFQEKQWPTDGRWVTLKNGQPVFLRNGKVAYGPKALRGKSMVDLSFHQLKRGDRVRVGKADRAGRRKHGGLERTPAGNLGEAIVRGELGKGGILEKKYGGPIVHLSSGKFFNFPVDILAGKHALEVKLLAAGVTSHEIRMRREAINRKVEMSRQLGLRPVTIGVYMDHELGKATIFARPGLASYPFTAMEQIGTVDAKSAVKKASTTKPGQEPLFKMLDKMGSGSKLVQHWQQKAASFAKAYRKAGTPPDV